MDITSKILAAGVCLSLLALPAAAEDGPVLKIENYIGTVDVITGDYKEIKVTDADGAPISESRAGITIDGDETIENVNCRQNSLSIDIGVGGWGWKKRAGGYKNLNEYPRIKITAPDDTHLVISNSVIFGEIGNIGSGDIHVRSCGDLDMADVSGELDLRISGSGDVSLGNAGRSDISVSGSGDISFENAGPVEVSISGSGDLEADTVESLVLSVSGSGDAQIQEVTGFAEIKSSGSGDVEIDDINGGLDYRGSGSSDFDADYVAGDLTIKTTGSGEVSIDDGDVKTLFIAASGSTNVDYDGKSVDAEASARGSSDVNINRPSGKLETSDSAGGDVNIDG